MKLAIAFLCCAFSLAASAQTASYDLLLKGGHVVDPKNHIDKVTDVAVSGGKIAKLADNIAPASAKKRLPTRPPNPIAPAPAPIRTRPSSVVRK